MLRKIKVILLNLKVKLAEFKAHHYDRILGIEIAAETSLRRADDNSDVEKYDYVSTFYGRLEKIIKYLKPTPEDIFVDLGCGKGRVIFFVASQRLKKVIGVELDKEIYAIAQKNLYNLRINKTHIELLNIDAVNFDVKEVTIFYMFNPFGYKTLEKVLNNIRESLVINPRNIRIVYYGPIFGHLLDKQNWLIREGKIEDDNCLVWRSKQ